MPELQATDAYYLMRLEISVLWHKKEFRQFFPNPGWVEHDANEIWSTQLGVAVEAMSMINAKRLILPQ